MSNGDKKLAIELALLSILRQGNIHHAFPLVIEIQAKHRACLRRVTVVSVEDGQEMITRLLSQILKATMLVVFPGPECRAVGLKTWTVNPSAFASEIADLRPEVLARKRAIA